MSVYPRIRQPVAATSRTAPRLDPAFQPRRKVSGAVLDTTPIGPATYLECEVTFTVHRAFDHRVDLLPVNLPFGLATKTSTNAKTALRFSRIKFSASTSA
jgi:hypothetical protein